MTDSHTELCERLRTISSCPGWDEAREAANVIESQTAHIQQQAERIAELELNLDEAEKHAAAVSGENFDLEARIAELEKERDALKADAQTWRSLLAILIHEIDKGRRRGSYKGTENAPLHGHAKVGIWDNDNGVLSGAQCAWCAVWNKARAALQAEKETRS